MLTISSLDASRFHLSRDMGKIIIETNKPVAYDSPDHVHPWGTATNNTKSRRFNRKLLGHIPPDKLKLLDIGCAGGGLVKSILDQGGLAVGIEGSDYSRKNRRAEWATVPDYLFTADATEPFALFEESAEGARHPLLFNTITAWEFFEHIAEPQIAGVVENIMRHLAPGGIVLASIATYPDEYEGAVLHQTVQEKPWWVAKFAQLGLQERPDVERYFHFDWLRGTPDWNPDYWSFTIALTRAGEAPIDADELRRRTFRNVPYEAARSVFRLNRRAFYALPKSWRSVIGPRLQRVLRPRK
jgi:SAM-dependent methyltransferase